MKLIKDISCRLVNSEIVVNFNWMWFWFYMLLQFAVETEFVTNWQWWYRFSK